MRLLSCIFRVREADASARGSVQGKERLTKAISAEEAGANGSVQGKGRLTKAISAEEAAACCTACHQPLTAAAAAADRAPEYGLAVSPAGPGPHSSPVPSPSAREGGAPGGPGACPAAPGSKVIPLPEWDSIRLQALATAWSPCIMTLVSIDAMQDPIKYQNPHSQRYYGDLQAGPQLYVDIVRALFSLEGEELKREMAAELLQAEEGTCWRRVMKVPAQLPGPCVARPQGQPQAEHDAGVTHGPVASHSNTRPSASFQIWKVNDAAAQEPPPGTATSDEPPRGKRHMQSWDSRKFRQALLASGSEAADTACYSSQTLAHSSSLQLPTYLRTGSGDIDSNNPSQNNSTAQCLALANASATSVAIRNVHKRVASLISSAMGSNTGGAGASSSANVCIDRFQNRSMPLFHKTSDSQLSEAEGALLGDIEMRQSAHRMGGQPGVSVASQPLPLPMGGGRRPACDAAVKLSGVSTGGSSGSSSADGVDSSGILLQPATLAPLQRGGSPRADRGAPARSAFSGTCGAEELKQRDLAQPLQDICEESTENVQVGDASNEEQQPKYCWHDVAITMVQHPEAGCQMMLILQSDVTTRSELEVAMAKLTECHLDMLCQIFPRHVIEFLSDKKHLTDKQEEVPRDIASLARSHENVTILFMDIVGFTTMSKQVPPVKVMSFLNQLFSVFDELASRHKVQKVETAGDCYIVAAGIVATDGEGYNTVEEAHKPQESAAKVFMFATDMLLGARKVLMPHNGSPVCIRIGIHSGPCVSGLIGSMLPKFSVFGDTMNTASRMESTCEQGRIQISSDTHSLLLGSAVSSQQEWQATGGVEVKGKGLMETFLWQEEIGRTMPSQRMAQLRSSSNTRSVSTVSTQRRNMLDLLLFSRTGGDPADGDSGRRSDTSRPSRDSTTLLEEELMRGPRGRKRPALLGTSSSNAPFFAMADALSATAMALAAANTSPPPEPTSMLFASSGTAQALANLLLQPSTDAGRPQGQQTHRRRSNEPMSAAGLRRSAGSSPQSISMSLLAAMGSTGGRPRARQ